MSLITAKKFDHDDFEEWSYRYCLEQGYSENEAREAARVQRDHLATRSDYPDRCSRCSRKLTVPFIIWDPYLYAPYLGFHIECTEPAILALERDEIANDWVHVKYTTGIVLDLKEGLIEHQHGHDFARNWYEQAQAKLGFGDEFIPNLDYIRQLLVRCGIKTPSWPFDLSDPDFHRPNS